MVFLALCFDPTQRFKRKIRSSIMIIIERFARVDLDLLIRVPSRCLVPFSILIVESGPDDFQRVLVYLAHLGLLFNLPQVYLASIYRLRHFLRRQSLVWCADQLLL